MPYYPIFLDLKNQKALVVGGGSVAERKVKNLLAYGCKVCILSAHLNSSLQKLADQKKIQCLAYESLDAALNDSFIVIAATDNSEINARIGSQAKEHGLLVNVVDQPEDCNFIMPSIVKRGDLQIAISTGGKSPALAKKIRKEMERIFGVEYGLFIELLGMVRMIILSQGKSPAHNKRIFQRLVNSNVLTLIKEEDWNGMSRELSSILGEGFPLSDILDNIKGV